MARVALEGLVFYRESGTENRYSHDGDVSNEWVLVTIEHLLTTAYRVFGALF